jgi:hypothetical protein
VSGVLAQDPDGGGCSFSCQQAGITCGDAVACGVVVHCGPPCEATGGGSSGTGGGTTGTGGGTTGLGGGTTGTGGGISGNPADCTGVTQPSVVTQVNANGVSDYEVNDFLISSGTIYLARTASVGGTTGWNNDGRVAHVAANGGTEQPWTQSETWPDFLQLVGTDLYYLDATWGKLKRIHLANPAPPQVVFSNTGTTLPTMNVYQVQGNDLFWAYTGASNATSSIWHTDMTTGQTDSITSGIDEIFAFKVDADGIYFVTSNQTANKSSLWTIPTGAMDPVDLYDIDNWETLRGIVTDAQAVYTLDEYNQTIVRIDKTTHAATPVATVSDAITFTIEGNTAWWMQSVCVQPSVEGCLAKNIEIHRATLGATSSAVLTTIDGWFYPEHMRTEGSCLFWDDRRTRSISRLAK